MDKPEDQHEVGKKQRFKLINGNSSVGSKRDLSPIPDRGKEPQPPMIKAAVAGSKRPDVISVDAFTIAEVSKIVCLQPHVLLFWESEFPFLKPQRNRLGKRVYRRKDIEIILRIKKLLYKDGLTIADARKNFSTSSKINTAIDEFHKLVETNPEVLSLINTLGDLCVRAGHTQEAINHFTCIAKRYDESGLILKSIAMYKKINKLEPSNYEISLKLAELCSKCSVF